VTTDRLLTAAELAEMLNVSPHWVRRHTHARANGIPHFRLGKYPRYKLDRVQEWLERQERGARRVA